MFAGAWRRLLGAAAGICCALAAAQAAAQAPDLVVEEVTVSDRTLNTGQAFTLSARVFNAGDGAAAATTLRYYRSTDMTIDSMDMPVGMNAVGQLAAMGRSPGMDIELSAPASAGTYYYGACVDDVTGETDTTNNCSAGLRVGVSVPDLAVEGVVVSDRTLNTGQSFNLRAAVVNRGNADAAGTTLTYYYSADTTIDTTTDTEVDTDRVREIRWSAAFDEEDLTSREDIQATAPTMAGDYYYYACVDAMDNPDDPYMANDCSASTAADAERVLVGDVPDLSVEGPSVSVTDGLVGPGQTFNFRVGVVNRGNGDSPATTLRYYRSDNSTLVRMGANADQVVGTDAVEALDASDWPMPVPPLDESSRSREDIDLTAPETAGDYYYFACVDDVSGETATGNNCTMPGLQIEVRGTPDLQIESPAVSSNALVLGQAFTLSARVFNAGDGAAAATTLRYYRSANMTIDGTDVQVGTDAVGQLAAMGRSPGMDIELNAPASAGIYYYGVCVDAVAGETDRDDNCSAGQRVEVSAPPDLEVAALVVSDITLNGGQSFNLSTAVMNNGPGDAPATVLRYYRAATAAIDRTVDVAVGTDGVRPIPWSADSDAEDLTSRENIRLTAPMAAGDYYYYACVDDVDGDSDANNDCSEAVRLLVGDVPDLAVEAASVSNAAPGPGQAFNFRVAVVNRGDGDSAATTLRYYLSDDNTLELTGMDPDELVGMDAVEALDASDWPAPEPPLGASSRSREDIDLDAPETAGAYYLFACVDDVPDETATDNNCTASLQVEVRGAPDLQIELPSVSNDDLSVGQAFTLGATVFNAGDGAAAATTLRYYRSTDARISPDVDVLVGTDRVRALATVHTTPRNPSAESRQQIALNAPASAGTYYYGVCVDAAVGETDTDNNCSAGLRVEVSAPPDLEVAALAVSDITLNGGQSFNLSTAVMNNGPGDAPATVLRYYRAATAAIDRTVDVAVGTDGVRPIPWSADSDAEDLTSRENIRLTAPMAAGDYYYYACVDDVDGDSDANNDCSEAVRLLVGDVPDLAVEAASVSNAAPGPGQAFNFRVAVVNRGDGDSAATTLRYYRSDDAAIDQTVDAEVGSDAVEALDASAWPAPRPPLSASSRSPEDIDLTAPRTAGAYYYFACVDALTAETDTMNNCTDGLRVEVGEAPNLQVESVSISEATLRARQAFTLSATVRNAGSSAAAATTLRYYRSAEVNNVDGNYVQVGTDELGGLAPAARSRQDLELRAPAVVGAHYYRVCVDLVPRETDRDDNCLVEDVEVTAPDLRVVGTAASDVTLNTGQSFNLRAAVVNGGRHDAAATTLRYYQSTDAGIDRGDVSVGRDSVRELRWSQAANAEDLTSREDIQLRAPAAAGIYHYYACVDAVEGELDIANNCSGLLPDDPDDPNSPDNPRDVQPELGVRVVVGNDPNLAAEGPSASASVVGPGQTFSFRVGVVNRGDGDSPATSLRYYRSRDRNVSSADTQVGTDEVPVLRASFPPSAWPDLVHPSSQTRQDIELTAPTTAGIHYYGACVATVPREADISDDCSVGVRVEVKGTPDLRIERFSVDDNRLLRRQSFNLTARVVNFGGGGSAATSLRYYRSEDAVISATDLPVGTGRVPQLEFTPVTPRNPAAQAEVQLQAAAPEELGVYYYGACVEPPPSESRTGNNCSPSVRVVVSSGPDLVVENLRLEGAAANAGKLFLGQPFRLTASVGNEGDGDFSRSILRFYRSTDAEVTAADVEVGSVNATPSAATGLGISLEAALPTGVRYYGACVDAVPNEVDADNNCAAAGVRVEVVRGPDLVVEAPAVDDDSLAPGQSFILQASVINDGDIPAAQTTVRYYRSADNRISTRDAPVGTDPVPALNIVARGIPWSASRSRQGVHLRASLTEGAYHYGACVDFVGRESNANNNCSGAVRVTVSRNNRAGDPDLALDASVSKSQLAPGGAFSLRIQVRNQGDEASEPTQLRYYRSTNAAISGEGDDLALGADLVEGIPKSSGDAAGQALHSRPAIAPNAPGAYYYGACIDPVAGESDVRNNCSQGVRVTVGDVADEAEDEDENLEEGMDEAAEAPPDFWRGWRSVLLRPPQDAS